MIIVYYIVEGEGEGKEEREIGSRIGSSHGDRVNMSGYWGRGLMVDGCLDT